MPAPKDSKLKRLRELRRYYQRVAERAKKRRAQRVLRRNRKKANVVLRAIRHRRRVLSADKQKRTGLVWMHGKQVPAWIAEDLEKARRAGWRGYVVSGYRTPAYSEQLCYGMCGRPRCPGMCAGRSSNHSQGFNFPQGAVDVTDYINLANIAGRMGLRIRNRLPRDRVHFSSSGQ